MADFEFPNDIMAGRYDDELTAISEALLARKEVLRDARRSEFKARLSPGDIVMIPVGSTLRPKYLHGKRLAVEKVLRTYVRVKPLDDGCRKYSAGFKLPMDYVEVVNS